MNITNHAKERYVERIVGISNRNEIKQYLAQNEDRIEKYILKLYKYSKLIYTGQIGGDKTTKDFRLQDDICLVVDNVSDCIRTIYKINFAFPEHTKMVVINDLTEEIIKLQEEITQEMQIIDIKKEEYDNQIEQVKQDLKLLNEKIKLKENEIKMYESEKNHLNKEIQYKNNYLQNYANQLFGNTDYKRDIK